MPSAADDHATISAYTATGVEQGVVALLGSKSTAELLTFTSHTDLMLMAGALTVVMSSVPPHIPLVGRVSSLMRQVFATITLNTILESVVVPRDPATTCVNLLGIFLLLGTALHQEDSGLTAQYVLVVHLTRALQAFNSQTETLAAAWALAVVPSMLGLAGDLAGLAQLVTVETFMEWVRSTLPPDSLLASSILLLYLTAPFMKRFPVLRRLYRFAVFAVTNDGQMHSTPLWLVGAAMWGLYVLEDCSESKAGKRFLAMAGANVAVIVLLDTARPVLDNDPALALISILLAIRILEAP